MTTPRRHHYVWKHYLRAWEKEENICVLRKGTKPFKTSPENVAVMRDFYRIPTLHEEDERFVQAFIEQEQTHPMLRKLNAGWLRPYIKLSRLRRFVDSHAECDAEVLQELERMEIQVEENLHGRIETRAVDLLADLLKGSCDLWEVEHDAMDFAFFISLQHMRTKRMRDLLAACYPEGESRDAMLRMWPVLRLILVTNMGWSLFSERAEWKLRALKVGGQIPFITTDQPTQNLMTGDGPNSLALFYPISPQRAVILEHRCNDTVVGDKDDLSDETVSILNQKMYGYSHEQVFGSDLGYLEKLSKI